MRIKERCLHFSLSKTEGDVTSFQTPTSTDDFVRVPLGKQKGENTSTFSADLPCRSRHATSPRAQTLHLPPSTGGHRHTVFFFILCLTFPRQKTLRSSISIKQHRERSQAQLACGLQCWYPYVRTRVERAQGCKLDHWMLMSLDPNSEISSLCAQGCELKSQEYVPSW